MSIFRKIANTTQSAFRKGGPAEATFRKISSGLGDTAGVLKQVGNIGSKIISNPLVQGVAMAVAPELAPAFLASGALTSGLLKSGSNIAKKAQNLTDVSSYKGSTLQNINDARTRLGQQTESNYV